MTFVKDKLWRNGPLDEQEQEQEKLVVNIPEAAARTRPVPPCPPYNPTHLAPDTPSAAHLLTHLTATLTPHQTHLTLPYRTCPCQERNTTSSPPDEIH